MRLAAILILLFGQSATKIVVLRTDAVTSHDGRVLLTLGEISIRLREPLAHVAATVASRAPGRGGRIAVPWHRRAGPG